MKTNKKALSTQRKIMERKILPWLPLRADHTPPTSWLKAIRGALGLNSRQLATRLGVEHASILQYEKSEAAGKISLHTLQKAARAMGCQLIYAIVPEDPFQSLEAVLDGQAVQAARKIVSRVDHSMRLEQQGLTAERSSEQVQELAARLKAEMNPSLWDDGKAAPARTKKSKKPKAAK
jgi:predicted DNA-binding mobile mystery protein A